MLVCNEGLGKELADLLRKEFGMPPHVAAFSVHFAADGPVTVDCTYYPAAREEAAAVEVALSDEFDTAPEPAPDPVALHNLRKL